MIETFYIIRNADESGVSWTGRVLNGCIFPDWTTVIRRCVEWKPNSTVVYDTYWAFREIHIDSHPTNKTEIFFETRNVNPSKWSDNSTPWTEPINCSTEEALIGIDPAIEGGDKWCKVYWYYDGEKFVVTRYEEEVELPQKIKLLRDRAGYPAGEYKYYDEKGFPSYLQSYMAWDEPVVVNIHPDIIKATSWQGIRSEVTDGENSLSRKIENSIPESPPLESKYEECAKEIQEVLNRRELRWNFPVLDRVMEAVKKYF